MDRIVMIGDVLVSPDIITEYFCCDLEKCKGECCVEGDAGAPVTIDEIAALEDSLDTVWPDLNANAQAVIEKQGVAYTDDEGDLVTSIVGGKDCVFTYYDDIEIGGKVIEKCCLCATEKAYRAGKSGFCKPISCALYPIREVSLSNGLTAINYHRWSVCQCGRDLGKELKMPVWRFLRDPLIRRFGEDWYEMLEAYVKEAEKR